MMQILFSAYIPYAAIYKTQDEIRKQGYWIPGSFYLVVSNSTLISDIPIHARIIHVEKDETSNFHLLNPFLYTIELTHGKYVWTVVRRYKQVLNDVSNDVVCISETFLTSVTNSLHIGHWK